MRARFWVAIDVFGRRSPNHAYGVRPGRDHLLCNKIGDGMVYIFAYVDDLPVVRPMAADV